MSRINFAVLAWVLALAFAVPLGWILISSLRPGTDIFRYNGILPLSADPVNYLNLAQGQFLRAIGNSLLVAGVTVVAGLTVCACAAFALSALRFRGAGVLFAVIVLSFLIPFDAISIPLSALFRVWKLDNTYTGLVLPGIGNGFAIFLLRQFFLAIPRELVEAARVDGMGWWRILGTIYLPLSKPTLVGAGLMLFLSQWQAYVWPLLIGTDPDKQLAPLALANLRGQFEVDFGQIFAGSLVLTVIPMILMLRYQRHFTQSIAHSGLKN